MDRKISDEQVERIAAKLLNNFALDEETLDEIAASPQMWRNVRGRIEDEKARRGKSLFAVFRSPVWAFGAAALIVCVGLAVLLLKSENNPNPAAVNQNSVQKTEEQIPEIASDTSDSVSQQKNDNNPAAEQKPVKKTAAKTKLIAKKTAKSVGKLPNKEIAPASATEETKTDFIALTYAAETDSGQIVRVKVPGSMMVALGVKANVEKESELVNAEVLLGDDGMARAIRFIL